jgi:hypothetical protein
MALIDTDPRLVEAAFAAIISVEPVGPNLAREAIFTHEGKEFWVKVTMDPHANTIDQAWVLPSSDPLVGRV